MPVDIAQPNSLSVYRGQSRSGQGEGPGKMVLQGEQYIRVHQDLYNADLLEEIRPWMTLDSDPADHPRLNDQLESWSLFSTTQYLFVVRLVSAGTYDQLRAAYFAHGRAWRLAALHPAFDPGLHLGRREAFDAPWRDEYPEHPRSEPWPTLVRPEQIEAESDTAARLMGHVLQASSDGYPLIVAAPLNDFISGGALHALISLARGGLPSVLRSKCRIRIYSRVIPDVFIRHLGANFVVVPEDTASAALAARPNATLLDRQGRRLAGKELAEPARDYAAAVVERAVAIPDGLPHFSERLRDLSNHRDARTTQIAYNVAFAFAGTTERRAELLRRYMPRVADKFGPGLDWQRLITAGEWRDFPSDAVLDQLLIDPRDLSPGRTELLSAIEQAVQERGLLADLRLNEWWNPDDPGKVRRLLELLTHNPPLVSGGAAAERTAQIPLARLVQTGPLLGALDAEWKNNLLPGRARESADLAAAAQDPAVFRLLSKAVSHGSLDPHWAHVYIRSAPPDKAAEAAETWLKDDRFFREEWGTVPKSLLDQLRKSGQVPATLASLIIEAARKLKPVEDLEIFLRLADVIARIDPSESENPLLPRLWQALPRPVPARIQDYLEKIAFDPAWECLRIRRLELSTLLRFAASLQHDEGLEEVYAELDRRMALEPVTVSDMLTRTGWWFYWRRKSRLRDVEILQRAAFAWMSSGWWSENGVRQATLEAWEEALKDLPASLSGADFQRLRNPDTRRNLWPWIPPFEDDQVLAFAGRAQDLGGLAELADMTASDWSVEGDTPSHVSLLSMSRWGSLLPAGALAWLVNERGRPEILSIEDSGLLYREAGHRRSQAMHARIESVAALLETSPEKALTAASEPSLWNERGFASKLAVWMARRETFDAAFWSAAERIHSSIQVEPAERPAGRSPELVRRLMDRGLEQAAQLLDPTRTGEIKRDSRTDRALKALLDCNPADSAWAALAGELAGRKEDSPAPDHPLLFFAQWIESNAPRGQRNKLARHGWATFERAAAHNPAFLASLVVSPVVRGATMLPLLRFAASMLGPGAIGNAALQLVFSAKPAFRLEVYWWRALFQAIREYASSSTSADDREDAAVALLFQHVQDPEQGAFRRALRIEGDSRNPPWPVSSEFGESTS